jgi:hypothetical protein
MTTKNQAAAPAKPPQSKAAKQKKASPKLSGPKLWRRLHEIDQQLKAMGVEWDLSAHTICISVEDIHCHNDGASVSHSMPLANGWSAEFVVSNSGGGVLIRSDTEVELGLDDLLALIAAKHFRLKTIGWMHLCQFDHHNGNETGWLGSPDCHETTTVIEETIRIVSPTGRVFTIDGPEYDDADTSDAEDDVSSELSVESDDDGYDMSDDDGYETYAGNLTVNISAGAESLRGSFPFEVKIDVWRVQPSDVVTEASVLTSDLEQQLRAVILEGEALMKGESDI